MSDSSRASGLVVAGLGWGIALGVAAGALVLAPAMRSEGEPFGQESAASMREMQRAESYADDADSLLGDHSAALVSGTLDDAHVTVLRTARAADEDVAAVRWLLDRAGAKNSGEIALTEKFTSQDSADALSSLIANTLPAGAQLSVEQRRPGVHAGESLGAALFADQETGEGIAAAGDRQFVLDALREGGFLDFSGDVVPADAIVIVGGDTADIGDDAETAGEAGEFGQQLLGDFADALGGTGTTVLSVREMGAWKAPELEQATFIEAVETEAGRIRTVLGAADDKES
ncbi:secreted protein, putative channel protein [Corynebacterium imitans]|uniref:Secreted protein, putative channel protein n=1 Tax=Corynebacterium imitans TaxID=156978 RepID=A0A239ZJI3_9CORY|nr:copper transporter [Corynebacterium imitans]SNV71511.1 secreted protein, putative channel protein [Corynebacterium imitans]